MPSGCLLLCECDLCSEERGNDMDAGNGLPGHMCPKCGGPMEPGRLAGLTYARFAADSERAKLVGKTLPVTVYRCQHCGYCEIYAQNSS